MTSLMISLFFKAIFLIFGRKEMGEAVINHAFYRELRAKAQLERERQSKIFLKELSKLEFEY